MPTPRPLPLSGFVDAARGTVPADLVFRNGRVVNVLTGEIHDGTVGVKGDRILGFGDYRAARPEDEIDLEGAFLAPALWDAHLHVESTMTTPSTLRRLAAAHGTAAVVTDPHEIANVRGVEGIRAFRGLPRGCRSTSSSCSRRASRRRTSRRPAPRSRPDDLEPLYGLPRVLGLAEMMNVPGFLFGDPGVRGKVEDARAPRTVPIDGHSPLLAGLDLNAYIGAGMKSDHECLSRAEAHEKVRRGMSIWIREGTAAKNLDDLLPLVTRAELRALRLRDRRPPPVGPPRPRPRRPPRPARHRARPRPGPRPPPRLLVVRAALRLRRPRGHRPRLPGRPPDVRARSRTSAPTSSFSAAGRVAKGGALLEEVPASRMDEGPAFRVDGLRPRRGSACRSRRAPRSASSRSHAGSLATGSSVEPALVEDGAAVADPSRDLLKLAVVERHRGTGNVGVAFARGFGLARGAIASSVAHDSHNVVVLGADDASMETAVRRIAAIGGGIVIADGARGARRGGAPGGRA